MDLENYYINFIKERESDLKHLRNERLKHLRDYERLSRQTKQIENLINWVHLELSEYRIKRNIK